MPQDQQEQQEPTPPPDARELRDRVLRETAEWLDAARLRSSPFDHRLWIAQAIAASAAAARDLTEVAASDRPGAFEPY